MKRGAAPGHLQMKMPVETHPFITCRELIDFLYLYLEGELAADRRREFERHLSVCPSCVNYIQTYRDAIVLEKNAFHDSAELLCEEAPEELVSAILAAARD